MNEWELLEVREMVLRDLADLIQDGDYGTVASYDPKIHELDYKLGKKLKFSSSHPRMTIRQRRASDLLMQLGLCGVAETGLQKIDDEGQLKHYKESLAKMRNDLTGLLRRYKECLSSDESKLLLSSLDAPQNQQDKPLENSERASLLKMVIGMAIGAYRYDPAASKNDAVSDITEDLEKLGIPLSDDTVRKYLKQAAEKLLPKP